MIAIFVFQTLDRAWQLSSVRLTARDRNENAPLRSQVFESEIFVRELTLLVESSEFFLRRTPHYRMGWCCKSHEPVEVVAFFA